MDFVQVVSIITSGLILFAVIELIRRNQLKERYSLIWLGTALVLIIFSIWRPLLHLVARTLGIYYPPSFLFLLGFAFLLLLLLHFSMIASSLSEKNKHLAQEIGLLKKRLRDLEGKGGAPEEKGE